MASVPDQTIGTPEAAKILGVSIAHVHNLAYRYSLLTPVAQGSRRLRLRRADVERLAREGWPGRRRRPSASGPRAKRTSDHEG